MTHTSTHASRHIQAFEARRHFAIAATANIMLASISAGATPVYTYNLQLNDTGTTNVGYLWFGWVPGKDFLPSIPTAVSSPAGWTAHVVGAHNDADGSSIQWEAGESAPALIPGGTLSGFSFSTTDSPATLSGMSVKFPGSDVLRSLVYVSQPFETPGVEIEPTGLATALPVTTITPVKPAKSYTFGQSIKLSAGLKSASSHKSPYDGIATLTEGDTSLGAATLTATGSIKISASLALTPGDHTLKLLYSGDTSHASGTSAPFTLHIARAATVTSLKTSPIRVSATQTLMLSAQLTAKTSTLLPSGAITFFDGDTALGTGTLDSHGAAVFSVVHPASGPHAYKAVFAADQDFATSTSALKKVKILAA